jgi:hypothetical protein
VSRPRLPLRGRSGCNVSFALELGELDLLIQPPGTGERTQGLHIVMLLPVRLATALAGQLDPPPLPMAVE